MLRGLGIERILLSFIKLYCEPTNLVLVLNTVPKEEEYFREILKNDGVPFLPQSINADVAISERQKIYPEGGVLFVTTRILVVDMLVERIPIDHVTGIIINRAHKVMESCQEAFILRLYRQKNKTGFIKAFSENATSFSKGFCQIEKVMKNLFLSNLYLWPRFRGSIVEYFEKNKVDVVELHIQMTKLMIECQACLLDLIDGCLKEIKKSHAILDVDELSVELALTKGFDKILRLQLDPIWHQLSQKTRQIVSDLRLLRNLLEQLVQNDSVHFCNQVDMLRTNSKYFNSNVGWLFTESADRLFMHSRRRIGIGKNLPTSSSQLEVELSPKWLALKEVLEEIEGQADEFLSTISSSSSEDVKIRVLVLTLNNKTSKQIDQYLSNSETFASTLAENYKLLKKDQEAETTGPPEKRKKNFKQKTNLESPQIDFTASDDILMIMSSLQVTIHPLRGREDPYSLVKTMEELHPHIIVLFDVEVSAVRRIELHRSIQGDKCCLKRVYFLMYVGSTEEQGYLTVLRQEKEAFEGLIKQKAIMVVPEEREGKQENDEGQGQMISDKTRKGGLTAGKEVIQKVVVDMREFRSELPSFLHKKGFLIEPVTLEVGDYILTPDICVERKSIIDLVGSLQNGRLYNQCLAMSRTYKKPVLLIEFDPNKSFTLQDRYPVSSEINPNDITSRMALLTLHFPKVRIIWCQGPHATAEIFEEIKAERDQPNADEAILVTSLEERDDSHSTCSEKYNFTPQDVLSKMPGVTRKNIYSIMNKVHSLHHLTKVSLQQLADIMGSGTDASLLHQFLNSTPEVVNHKFSGVTTSSGEEQKICKTGRERFSLNKFAKK